jgi:hypothetical protein
MQVLSATAARIEVVRRRGRDLLCVLLRVRDSGAAIGVLCENASTVFDEFSAILADDLRAAALSVPEPEAEQLRREYVALLTQFGASVRDIIDDRDARHALAQAMQCAILRHERSLREVITPAIQE